MIDCLAAGLPDPYPNYTPETTGHLVYRHRDDLVLMRMPDVASQVTYCNRDMGCVPYATSLKAFAAGIDSMYPDGVSDFNPSSASERIRGYAKNAELNRPMPDGFDDIINKADFDDYGDNQCDDE